MNAALKYLEEEVNSEYYPTPPELAKKMIEGIDFSRIHSILEPSAGKGAILRELAKEESPYNSCLFFDVDCIEIDAGLRQVLKYQFSQERKDGLFWKERKITDSRKWNQQKREYEPYTEEQIKEREYLQSEQKYFFHDGIHIVHDDFLTFESFKKYDLVLMNPPFSVGDKHLLKALDLQKDGGSICCLLNAETFRNPYTSTRKALVEKLRFYNAEIEYIEHAFSHAERATDVEVALIKVFIPEKERNSEFFERMVKAENVEDYDFEATDLDVTDFIKSKINLFRVESQAGLALIREYQAMLPYIQCSFKEDRYVKPTIQLMDAEGRTLTPNKYLKEVRTKYWTALLNNPKFTGKLTSKLRNEWYSRVGELCDYDFTEFNIYTIACEMNAQVRKGIEDEIIDLFDKLTEEHNWCPETHKNRHYYDGWATNKAHKIGKKVILPCYGVFDSWDGKPRTYNAYDKLADIERCLNFFDGNMGKPVDLSSQLEWHFNRGLTKKVELKFFNATFYKKGTDKQKNNIFLILVQKMAASQLR